MLLLRSSCRVSGVSDPYRRPSGGWNFAIEARSSSSAFSIGKRNPNFGFQLSIGPGEVLQPQGPYDL